MRRYNNTHSNRIHISCHSKVKSSQEFEKNIFVLVLDIHGRAAEFSVGHAVLLAKSIRSVSLYRSQTPRGADTRCCTRCVITLVCFKKTYFVRRRKLYLQIRRRFYQKLLPRSHCFEPHSPGADQTHASRSPAATARVCHQCLCPPEEWRRYTGNGLCML